MTATAIVATNRLEFAPPPAPGLVRSVLLAVLAHGVLLAVLSVGVQWHRQAPSVSVQAELWSAIPQEAAPPPPEPEPVKAPPLPPPPPPKADADIAQEKEKSRVLKEKAALQEKVDEEKKKLAQDQEKQKKLKAQQAQDAQNEKQLEEIRKETLNRMTRLAGATDPTATGTAARSSGPSASYQGKIQARVIPNITLIETVPGNPIAEVEVNSAADGTILSRKLFKSSGVKSWDDAVINAIDKTARLPADENGLVPSPMIIVFSPQLLIGKR
jgi:colicin import membrane protein